MKITVTVMAHPKRKAAAEALYAKEENYYREEYKEIVNDLEEKIEERGGILYDHNNFTFKS